MGRHRAMLKYRIKRKIQSIIHFFKSHLVSILWLAVSLYVWNVTDFFHVLFSHPLIIHPFRTIAIIGFTSITIITIYVCFGLPSLYDIHNVEEYNPNLIKVGAALSGLSFLSIMGALWPVWGMYSIALLFILRKGFYAVCDILPRKKYNEFSTNGVIQVGSSSSRSTCGPSCPTGYSERSFSDPLTYTNYQIIRGVCLPLKYHSSSSNILLISEAIPSSTSLSEILISGSLSSIPSMIFSASGNLCFSKVTWSEYSEGYFTGR